jgi:peptidoglycan/LPS O-acetylase OafA/YrhL
MSVATRFDNVQALRGIAALMVCVFHLAGHSDGAHRLLPEVDAVLRYSSYGPTGVFVFFVISGFIIPFSMHKSQYQVRDFFSFFKKRLWRLHPPYILTLLLTIILVLFNNAMGKTNEDVSAIRVLSHLFYTTKIMNLDWFNPIFWTLAIEIQYYLLLALLFSWFNGEKMWQRMSFVLLMLASTYFLKDDKFITFYIGPFVLGFSIFYFLIKKVHFLECALYASLASINILYFVGPHWLIASTIAVFFILFIVKTPSVLNNLGEISYSLYLTHPLFGGLFIYLLLPYNSSLWSGYAILIGAIIFSIITSQLFYRLIERRSIEWSKKI